MLNDIDSDVIWAYANGRLSVNTLYNTTISATLNMQRFLGLY